MFIVIFIWACEAHTSSQYVVYCILFRHSISIYIGICSNMQVCICVVSNYFTQNFPRHPIMPIYVYFKYCDVCAIGVWLTIWGFTLPNKWNQSWFEHSYGKLQSSTVILAKYLVFCSKWCIVCLVYIAYTFSLSSSTT